MNIFQWLSKWLKRLFAGNHDHKYVVVVAKKTYYTVYGELYKETLEELKTCSVCGKTIRKVTNA